jgi:hypothetical protein
VAANPYPLDNVAYEVTDRTVMSAYSDRKTVGRTALELFKIERGMMIVVLPKVVTPSLARLDMRR